MSCKMQARSLLPFCPQGQDYYECAIGLFTGCCSHNPCTTGICGDQSTTTTIDDCSDVPTSTKPSLATSLKSSMMGGPQPTVAETTQTHKSLTTSFTTETSTITGGNIFSDINSDLSSATALLGGKHPSSSTTSNGTSPTKTSTPAALLHSLTHGKAIVITLVVLAFLVALFLFIFCCIRRRRRNKSSSTGNGLININFNRNKATTTQKDQIRVLRNTSEDERRHVQEMDIELDRLAIMQRQQQREELEREGERRRVERMRRDDASVLAERQSALDQLEGRR